MINQSFEEKQKQSRQPQMPMLALKSPVIEPDSMSMLPTDWADLSELLPEAILK